MPGRRKPVKNEEFDENKQVFIFVNSKFAISRLHSFTLHFLQGDYIWIEPVSKREFDVAIGARVVSAEGRKIQVRFKNHPDFRPKHLMRHCMLVYYT